MMQKLEGPIDSTNYVAIELLEQLGLDKPNQAQIDLMESIVSTVMVKKKLLFDTRLTPKEQFFLYWVARGKTMTQAGELLDLTMLEVDEYHNQVRTKLHCHTLTQAVFEGLRFGYLSKNG